MDVKTPLGIVSFFLFGLISGATALPPPVTYSVTDLGVLPGGEQSAALGLNSRGEVVGWSEAGGETADLYTTTKGVVKGRARHAFLWKNGVMHDLGVLPGYDSSTAVAINTEGSILGNVFNIYSRSSADFSHSQLKPSTAALFAQDKITLLDPRGTDAVGINDQGQIVQASGSKVFLHINDRLTDIGAFPRRVDAFAPFLNSTVGHAINNEGQIVGTGSIATATTLLFHAFIWQSGKMTDLGPNLGQTEAFGINDNGVVVGLAGGLRACLWDKGQFRDLSEGWSRAWGINNRNQVVGLSHEEQFKYRDGGYGHAVLWQDGHEYALNDLLPPGSGWVLNEAHAINDQGRIVGFGEHNGHQHAFLLLPQQ